MQRATLLCLLVLCSCLSFGCSTMRVPPSLIQSLNNPPEVTSPIDDIQIGSASFYHPLFNGRRTANGETYSDRRLTAAHRTLDFGTRVLVTNLDNAKSVVVTINDRGPYVRGRIIDLSRRAARVLGFVRDGTTRVRVDPLT